MLFNEYQVLSLSLAAAVTAISSVAWAPHWAWPGDRVSPQRRLVPARVDECATVPARVVNRRASGT
jgi:hypothetical protein